MVEIYSDDVKRDYTFAVFRNWFRNLRKIFQKYFATDIRSFIQLLTINNKILLHYYIQNKTDNIKKYCNWWIATKKYKNINEFIHDLLIIIRKEIPNEFEQDKMKMYFVESYKNLFEILNIMFFLKQINLSKSTYYDHKKKLNESKLF